jgi:uncharacterized protein (TIGR01244 family)
MSSIAVRQIAVDVCVAGQLTPEAMAAAAAAAGLSYHFLPVDPGYQTPEQIAAFSKLLEELPKPMLVFCRTGNRSANLFRQASQR